MIQIYNTLSRKKEIFEPQEEGRVKMYVCGPTVYNYIHIGNARSTAAFDTIRRYLEYRGYNVTYVSNFTDVDDKIINRAKELDLSPKEVADKYIAAYYQDTEALNVRHADISPRVFDHIDDIIKFVKDLVDKGYAYESDGDVYYHTRAFEDYGKLSRTSIDDLAAGASNRLEEDAGQKKKDVLDFALWKRAKEDEISWDSPWGQGRPGWHIECSVMSTKHLGDTLDIHAGGQDLEFPHHENEIAQSEAKTGHLFAKYWMHNGFVTMDDEKMSKSLGNIKLVKDLRELFDPQVLRFFLSTAHYRRPINYTDDGIHEAQTNLKRIQTVVENAHYRLDDAVEILETDAGQLKEWDKLKAQFVAHMDDDFQTQNGISDIYEMVRYFNRYLDQTHVSKAVIHQFTDDLKELLAIFGVLDLEIEKELLDEEVDQLIAERNQARENKDFQRADEIRDQLKDQGIILEDTPQGIRWKRADV